MFRDDNFNHHNYSPFMMLGHLSATDMFAVLTLAVILQQVCSILRRVQQHLPSYTTLSGVSHLPYILQVYFYEPFRTRCLAEAHKTQKIIRLTPSHWSFSSSKAVQDIYGHKSCCVKGDVYTLTAGTHYSILNTPSRIEHRVKRKRLAAAFAMKNLLNWENKVVDKVERFLVQMDQRCSPVNNVGQSWTIRGAEYVDLRKWFNLFSIEAIADIASSQNLGLLEKGNDIVPALSARGNYYETAFIEALHGGARSSFPFVFSDNTIYPWLTRIVALLSARFRTERTNSNKFGDIIRWIVQQRQERGKVSEHTQLDDFATCLLGDLQAEQTHDLDEGEILAEMAIFMDAGSDTTAIALTHVLWHLIKHPKKLTRLRNELAPLFSAADNQLSIISYTSLSQSEYLRACLNEALRLHPPLSAGLQRKPSPTGTVIDGQFVPGHVNVSVSAYVLHRNPEIFPDPEVFHPERWLANENRNSEALHPSQDSFIPFSLGPRGCIGRNITYIEQTLLLAALVHRYDFALPTNTWEMEWEERSNLWPKDLPVRLSRRF